jgi:3-deoxy-D-manno-octulosonic-acid transferase
VKAFVKYRKKNLSKLFIVPRHPERFEEVFLLMKQFSIKENLTLSRFSQIQKFETDMILIDTIGELNNIYNISDIAILGGAFEENIGGHNPLEPAKFSCKIITGKYFFHQKELFKYLKNVQYVEKDEIYEALEKTKYLKSSVVTEKINLEPIINKILEI